MSTHLCNFTTLSDAQKAMVLAWRNHDAIKAYMYNTHDISEAEHLNFIESLKSRTDRCYFLVQHEGIDIGVIDFNDISEHSATLGVYANPHLTQKGLGIILMNAIIDYAFHTLNVRFLKADVFADNMKAKALYEKYGFCEKARKNIHEKELICMELENENCSL